MKLIAYCQTCGHQHAIDTDPSRPDNQCIDWYTKHAGHRGVGIIAPRENPRRTERLLIEGWRQAGEFWRWLRGKPLPLVTALRRWGREVPLTQLQIAQFLHNANANISYAASTAFTITLTSLATSSTLVTGRQGTSVTNSSNKYLDYAISGSPKTGSVAPTASTYIESWIIPAINDTPTWPDTFGASDAGVTVTSRNQLFSYGLPVNVSILTTATATSYPFHITSLAALTGGICPRDFVPFLTQSSGQNLDSTTGGFLDYQGVYLTIA